MTCRATNQPVGTPQMTKVRAKGREQSEFNACHAELQTCSRITFHGALQVLLLGIEPSSLRDDQDELVIIKIRSILHPSPPARPPLQQVTISMALGAVPSVFPSSKY